MATELGARVEAVRKWRQRNSIPAEWWQAIAATAPGKTAGVTAEVMASLAARAPGGPDRAVGSVAGARS